MNIPKKLSTYAYKSLVKQGVVETILENEVSAMRDWRFAYDLEGGPALRNPKKSENPWRPWAEAMVKWACTPPFQPSLGGLKMEDLFRPVLQEILSELREKDHRSAWRLFSAEVPQFLMSETFVLAQACNGVIRPDYLPERFQTPDFINQVALKNKAYVESFKNVITEETALALCTREGSLLRDLDDRLRTAQVVDAAMKSCSWAFDAVPKALKTSSRCLTQVKLHKSLSYVPEGLISQEMCDIAISSNLREIEYAPKHMVNPQSVFNGAVSDPSNVAKHAPAELVDENFIDEVIKSNPRGINTLSDRVVTDEMILGAIRRNVINFQHIRSHRVTDEMADLLVEQRADAFPFLADKHRTLDRALKVIDRFPYVMLLMKMENFTDEDLLNAVRADYKVLALLPKERVTAEMDLEALRQNGELLRMVNVQARTPAVCLEALSSSELALKYVPKDVLASQGFRQQAIRRNPALVSKLESQTSPGL